MVFHLFISVHLYCIYISVRKLWHHVNRRTYETAQAISNMHFPFLFWFSLQSPTELRHATWRFCIQDEWAISPVVWGIMGNCMLYSVLYLLVNVLLHKRIKPWCVRPACHFYILFDERTDTDHFPTCTLLYLQTCVLDQGPTITKFYLCIHVTLFDAQIYLQTYDVYTVSRVPQ